MITTLANFSVGFQIGQPGFSGLQGVTQILQKLNFTNVDNVLIKEGSYTPANDYVWLWETIPAGKNPNFIFLMTQGIVNVSAISNGQLMCNSVPANKLFLLTLPLVGSYQIDNLFIEGRTNVPTPMAQGATVQYYCFMAQASF